MAKFEMNANYVAVMKPRTPDEKTILRFESGHGFYAYISLTADKLAELREKLEETS